MMMTNNEVDDAIKSNMEKVTDMLEKRNRERLLNLDTKHEMNKKNLAESEDHEYFLNTFRMHAKQIDDNIDSLRPGDHVSVSNQISQQIGDIQNLQNYLTASTLFLSNYTIKACQTTINELTTKLELTKSKLITKRKFGFRSKQELPTVTDVTETKTDGPQNGKPATPADISHINWTVQNRCNEEIIIDGDTVHNQDITMANLNNCIICIFGHPGSVQFSHIHNCIVLCGPVSRSVFADNCKQTTFSFGCQQLRLHSSTQCDIYIHVTSRAIIEDCTSIRVAPLSFRYETIDQDFIKSGLDITKNNWNNIADFNWLSSSVRSPNWIEINECDRVLDWQDFLNKFRKDSIKT